MGLKKESYPILFLAFLFTVKALYLAFYVTPLWDIPDETAHFSYVRDLAEGRGLPVLGNAWIMGDVMDNVWKTKNCQSISNWIAQHPPIYHLIAAIPLKIGSTFIVDSENYFRLPRIVAAISGGGLLIVIFSTMIILGLDSYRATILSAGIGFIPMVSNLSSGTNHDMTLFLFSALVVFFLIRYLLNRRLTDAYWCSFWMTLASGIKMTAWILIPFLIIIFAFEIRGTFKYRSKHILSLFLISMLAPAAWMVRNIIYFGNPIYTSINTSNWQSKVPLTDSFFHYFHSQPVVEQLALNFYGLLGWIGTGQGRNILLQIDGFPRRLFSVLLVTVAIVLMVFVIKVSWSVLQSKNVFFIQKTQNSKFAAYLSKNYVKNSVIVAGMAISFFSGIIYYFISRPSDYPTQYCIILFSLLMVMNGVLSFFMTFYTTDQEDRIVLYALIVFLYFSALLIWNLYNLYLLDGRLRAVHGRYFYPVVPFILAAIAISVKRMKISGLFLGSVVSILAIMELDAFILQALPFYGSAPK